MAHPSKVKGDKFERSICDYLAEAMPCERIPAGASEDRGDLWVPGNTVQCKNQARIALPAWWNETRIQTNNNGHLYGWLIHKRHGVTDPAAQWVTCDVAQLRSLLAQGTPR